jgi:hypothetical protein
VTGSQNPAATIKLARSASKLFEIAGPIKRERGQFSNKLRRVITIGILEPLRAIAAAQSAATKRKETRGNDQHKVDEPAHSGIISLLPEFDYGVPCLA